MLKYKYIFQIKYTEAILSNSTRKLLWFEISKMVIAVLKINLLCFYYNFRYTFVPYSELCKIGLTDPNADWRADSGDTKVPYFG